MVALLVTFAAVADDADVCAVVVQWSQASLNTSHQQLDHKLVCVCDLESVLCVLGGSRGVGVPAWQWPLLPSRRG
jgi:hypothetical protein